MFALLDNSLFLGARRSRSLACLLPALHPGMHVTCALQRRSTFMSEHPLGSDSLFALRVKLALLEHAAPRGSVHRYPSLGGLGYNWPVLICFL